MTVKEWMVKTFDAAENFLVRPRALCLDGFSISIQANQFIYCAPRQLLADGDYCSLELGFASEYEELLEEYRKGTIYPYVPMELAEKVIEKHGGIISAGKEIEAV